MKGQLVVFLRSVREVTYHEYSGSYFSTLRIVAMLSDSSLRTWSDNCEHCLNTPLVLEIPMPSTISRVRRKGISSGIRSNLP